MSQFDHHASVHPHTVTEISKREPDRPGRKFYGRTERNTGAFNIKVDPRVWNAALNACAGDPRRIEVIDAQHVEIHNDPEWRKHRVRWQPPNGGQARSF